MLLSIYIILQLNLDSAATIFVEEVLSFKATIYDVLARF